MTALNFREDNPHLDLKDVTGFYRW